MSNDNSRITESLGIKHNFERMNMTNTYKKTLSIIDKHLSYSTGNEMEWNQAVAKSISDDLFDEGLIVSHIPTHDRMIELIGEAWDDGNSVGLDGWVGPGRGSNEVDEEALRARSRAIKHAKEKINGDSAQNISNPPRSASPDQIEEIQLVIEDYGRECENSVESFRSPTPDIWYAVNEVLNALGFTTRKISD